MPRQPGRTSTRLTYPLTSTLIHRHTTLSTEGRLRCSIEDCGSAWDAWTGGSWGTVDGVFTFPVCPSHTAQIIGASLDPPF